MFKLTVGKIGDVKVVTAQDGGLPVEEWAERLTDRIVYVGDQSHPAITAQAHAFKQRVHSEVFRYMNEVARSERDRIACQLENMGLAEAAQMVREER